ncbi:MAG: hypothetical protein HYW48_11500 [Deltaproteobacteria bacterium]|nr:hypothetical protein [Deltaproteobacteria bacterium]
MTERFSGIGTKHLRIHQIASLKERGKMINIWTVNQKSEMTKWFQFDVNYVTTDFIEDCLEILSAEKTY